MKILKQYLFLLVLLYSSTLFAEKNNTTASNVTIERSDKLDIKFIILEDSPEYGAIDYEQRYPGKDEFINIRIEFNIPGVKTILVSDVNAENNICNRNQVKHSIYLSFAEPEKNQTSVTTHISEPCYINGIATLKLYAKTNKNRYFYNLAKLPR